jgi:DNA-binding MarR family transcriptional regulator
MSLESELSLLHPIQNPAHAATISLVLTGELFAKEGDRLLRPFGLTDSQFNVLMLLKYQTDREGINQTQLGRMLLVNRSNVTGLIDRMEQAGWVSRRDQADDRRVKLVALTPAGRKLLDRAEKVYFERVDKVVGTLKAGELQTLCSMLETLRARLR